MPPRRRAARGLVIDERGGVLLFRSEIAGREPWWFAPGGAVEAGETFADALVRELAEETGLTVALSDVGSAVWKREYLFTWNGVDEIHVEQFFVVRVLAHQMDTSGFAEGERDVIREQRWWSVEEIARSGEHFSPARMAELLRPLIAGTIPLGPIDAGD